MAENGPDDLDVLTRFACFGSEKGTVNVLARHEYRREHTPSINTLLSNKKGLDAVRRLKAVSKHKCYVSKESLLFALAYIIRESDPEESEHKDDSLRNEAYTLVQDLCDSSSNLFTFIHYVKQVSLSTPQRTSWGRGMRKLVCRWYGSKSSLELAREATRCKSGHGWSHKDVLTQVHFSCKTKPEGFSAVVGYVVKGKGELETVKDLESQEDQGALALLKAVERLKSSQEMEREVIRSLIEENVLIDRQIPTHFYRLRETYEGLIGHMPLADVFRTLPKMAHFGMLERMSPTIGRVVDRIKDVEAVKQEKVSPVVIFIALRKYDMNRAKRWTRNAYIVRLLHLAYIASLEVAPKLGKRVMLAIHLNEKILRSHVSGANILTSIMPCAVMCQMFCHAEENVCFTYFTSTKVSELDVTKDMSTVAVVEQIVQSTKDQGNRIYNLGDPLVWAGREQRSFDSILIMAEKKSSVAELPNAIASYRTQCNLPNAKVAVIGLNDFTSVAGDSDLNFLDVSGFNSEVPNLIYNFFKGVPDNDV